MFQLNKILFENNNMKDSGANGVFIKSIQPNKDDIDVEAQIAIRFNIANANKTMEEMIDEAFDTSDDANATIISDNALSARSCSGFDLATLRPPAPSYLQTTFALDHTIQSGFYVYFTCKKTPYPELAYR